MNVGLVTEFRDDGTSFYRAVGPFSYLARETGIRLDFDRQVWDWSAIMQLDAMVLQRPFTAPHAMVARTCKALNVPLWVDYDDLYTAFPDWLQSQRKRYGGEDAVQNLRECIGLADVVTVTTQRLADEFGPKCVVVPNALNTYIWPLSEPTERKKVITWRGSACHLGDLEPMIPVLRRFKADYPDWEFHFLGEPHFKCFELGTVHPKRDLLSYMQTFKALRPAIHIAPLADCVFNRCKSNIAWIEAAAAGAVTVARSWPEWQRPGVVNYSEGGLYDALRYLVSRSESERERLCRESQSYIDANLRLSVVNRQRVEILKRLTGR